MAVEYVVVGEVGDLESGQVMVVEIDDYRIAVCNLDGTYYAIDDVCTHDGGPLGEGWFTGDEIECPRHGARFCVKTGKPLCMPAVEAVDCYTVKVEDDHILISVD